MITEQDQQEELAYIPVVSVVIPVHNGADVICTAVDSVLSQHIPLEILIIDDGSTDDLNRVLSVYKNHMDIRLIRNEKNLGVAESRNRGVREARGAYVAFLDCDDWWESAKLEKQLTLLKETGYVLCATARRIVKPDGRKTERIIPVKTVLTYKDLLYQNPINCSSVLMKRLVALEFPMGHDECHEDYITWFRVLKKYGKVCAINEPLLNYRLTTTGKSGNKLKSAKMTYMVYKQMKFGTFRSIICFIGYAFNGLKKYLKKN